MSKLMNHNCNASKDVDCDGSNFSKNCISTERRAVSWAKVNFLQLHEWRIPDIRSPADERKMTNFTIVPGGVREGLEIVLEGGLVVGSREERKILRKEVEF
ncbi:hypothetical protein GWI33_020178 [Rhynchophorus ferrugineus]|uniref:Uncharacterized protein n=1 Tax=Rhynchophorus ferrugineus TaxID=354439 RepID=A0A834HUS8_RHYFE|nr:hypothetical protein GWI33_020178 [Rhynchophorus ferrugineus]